MDFFFDKVITLRSLLKISILELFDSIELENLHNIVRETAPRHFSVALHKKHNIILCDPLINLLSHIATLCFSLRIEVGMTIEFAFVGKHSKTIKHQQILINLWNLSCSCHSCTPRHRQSIESCTLSYDAFCSFA